MVGSRSWPIPVRKGGGGAAEGAGQLRVVARMELESPTAILDWMEHTETDASRGPPVVLAVLPNLLSATRLVLGLAFATVPESWRLVVVVVAGATEFLCGLTTKSDSGVPGGGEDNHRNASTKLIRFTGTP